MAESGYDYLVAFNLHTCGAVGEELGTDESDIILIAWAIVDAKQNTVSVNGVHRSTYTDVFQIPTISLELTNHLYVACGECLNICHSVIEQGMYMVPIC